ncbi:MAG: PIG-L family deacetylase, partial [Terracidiphilus sp.]
MQSHLGQTNLGKTLDANSADWKCTYDVLAFGAHPDDLEAVMGGTVVKLARKKLSVLFVDLCEGEPTPHGARGEPHQQALKAAKILGVERATLTLQDSLIRDTVEARMPVARLIRECGREWCLQRLAWASTPI